ncbi:MAG TPA: glycosyltransferase N-terminal domain-containing protein, partial [Longimicrobiales bacterium]
PAQPLVWVHAPSVGESLMAQAIIAEVRALRADAQIAFTHFSPSAEQAAARVGADVHDYMPWDTRHDARVLIDFLQPAVIAFVRTEIWPALVREARSNRVPRCLVNGVLGPRSSRLKPAARWLLRDAYAGLSAVGAVSRDHGERFLRMGVPESRLSITGDARFDQVVNRIEQLDREQPLLQRLRDDSLTTVVAGSTWPSDEAELLEPLAQARKGCPMRIIMAPHEPEASYLRGLENRLDGVGLKHMRLSEVEGQEGALPEVVIVDRTGVLADLYAIAHVAYVGGGFHDAGLHSVVEPAALGVPVVFGPRHGNAREADELAGSGGGFVASDGAAVASLIQDLANRKLHHQNASQAARAFVQTRLGAARRNAELIVNLIRV